MMLAAEKTSTKKQESDRPLVSVQKLSLIFGKQTVLKDIELEIPKGQTLAIIGESGCGKTMLLKSLVGLMNPTSGKVLFDQIDIHSLGDVELTKLRKRFGFVFQNAALFDSMTIKDNVAFPLLQHGIAIDNNSQKLIQERLAEVGLPNNVASKRPSQLSGGMRKRVGLARALILKPDLVLYDEPTTGLDPIMSDVINELILKTRQGYPVTSVMVTHDMNSAKKVADRIVMLYPYSRLEEGESQIIFDGTPDEINHSKDRRVYQFINGEAGDRLMEMRSEQEVEAKNATKISGKDASKSPAPKDDGRAQSRENAKSGKPRKPGDLDTLKHIDYPEHRG